MIFDVLILIAVGLLHVLLDIFSLFQFVLPQDIENAIIWLFSLPFYFSGIINLPVLYTVLYLLFVFYSFLYLFKMILWVYHHLPWIGKSKKLPDQKHSV